MNHDKLKKQFEAEAAFNLQAHRNWQSFSTVTGWVSFNLSGPSFYQNTKYRRDPSKPPFVAPTMKERAMERVGEVPV
jgi:hypothetical protein